MPKNDRTNCQETFSYTGKTFRVVVAKLQECGEYHITTVAGSSESDPASHYIIGIDNGFNSVAAAMRLAEKAAWMLTKYDNDIVGDRLREVLQAFLTIHLLDWLNAPVNPIHYEGPDSR